jgi:hypothetical protein
MATEQIDGVEFRDVPGFPGYRVGSDGSLWSRWRQRGTGSNAGGTVTYLSDAWRKRKVSPDSRGYTRIKLTKDGRIVTRFLHRIVLESFVGPCPAGMECCHDNGIASDCRPSNLRWDTPKSNQADRIRHGTDQRGILCPQAKLTEEIVVEALTRLSRGEPARDVGPSLGIKRRHLNCIRAGKTWRHVFKKFMEGTDAISRRSY